MPSPDARPDSGQIVPVSVGAPGTPIELLHGRVAEQESVVEPGLAPSRADDCLVAVDVDAQVSHVQPGEDAASPLVSVSRSPPRIPGEPRKAAKRADPFPSARACPCRATAGAGQGRSGPPGRAPEQRTAWARRSAVHVGKPVFVSVVCEFVKAATLFGSPSGTVIEMRAPGGFANATARLSWLLIVSEVPAPSGFGVDRGDVVGVPALLDRRRRRLAVDADGERDVWPRRAERNRAAADRKARVKGIPADSSPPR